MEKKRVTITFAGLWVFVRQPSGVVDAVAVGATMPAHDDAHHHEHAGHGNAVHVPLLFVPPPFEHPQPSRFGKPYLLEEWVESRLIIDRISPDTAVEIDRSFPASHQPEQVSDWRSFNYVPSIRDIYPTQRTLSPAPTRDGRWLPTGTTHVVHLSGGRLRANPPDDEARVLHGFPYEWTPADGRRRRQFVASTVTYEIEHDGTAAVEFRLFGAKNVAVNLLADRDVTITAVCEPFTEPMADHPGKLPHIVHAAMEMFSPMPALAKIPHAEPPLCPDNPDCPSLQIDVADFL